MDRLTESMRGLRRRRVAVWGFVAAVLLSAAAPSYHFTRPRVRCGVPARDYQFATFSPHLVAISRPALSVMVPTDNTTPVQTAFRLYQFDVAKLKLDHCSISEMALNIYPEGRWRLNLRADQNPRQLQPLDIVPNVTTAQPATSYTADLKRNLFYVRVRCYAAGGGGQGSTLGKAVMATLKPDPFWVQRGEPQMWVAEGYDDELRRFSPLIERVGIEFYYREATERKAATP